MSKRPNAYIGARIFDGIRIHDQYALITKDELVLGICPEAEIPGEYERIGLRGGILSPGFVDLQVNGGGGLMFNTHPTVETLKTMAAAHRSIGATTILPTLITDTPETTRAAIDAAVSAAKTNLSGLAGLHLEGPHLATPRKGAHKEALIRPMTDEDLEIYLAAANDLPVLKITLAPENVSRNQIRRLSEAGVLVSLGHSDASFDECRDALAAGARCITHLFNAQSQLGNREPGVVGAALSLGGFSAGLIADGIHVHPATIAVALQAKQGPGEIFLVSDAMATAGAKTKSFELNGRTIRRSDDRLTLDDGTLAGAHLDLATAVRTLVRDCFVPLETALAKATSIPAALIGQDDHVGHFKKGAKAEMILLDEETLELLKIL